MSTQRGSTWSREETEELIAVWGEESIQAQLEGARQNNKKNYFDNGRRHFVTVIVPPVTGEFVFERARPTWISEV